MKKGIRLAALALAGCFLLLCVAGCSGKKKAAPVTIGVCGNGSFYSGDVLFDELRYVTLTYKDSFEATYGKGLWEDPELAAAHRAELEDVVWKILRNNHAVLAACRYYMPEESINSPVIDETVEENMKNLIAAYDSREDFEAELENLHMTEDFVRFSLRVTALENELLYVLKDDFHKMISSDREFLSWLDEGNCVYVQHIFLRNDIGDDPAKNLSTAQDLRRQLVAGAVRIEDLINSPYNEDTTNTAPYYIVRGVYTEEIENAAFALDAPGDVSSVVTVEDGYYVLCRMEDSSETLASSLSDLLLSYQWAMTEEIVDGFKEALTFDLNEYGKSLDLLEIK